MNGEKEWINEIQKDERESREIFEEWSAALKLSQITMAGLSRVLIQRNNNNKDNSAD